MYGLLHRQGFLAEDISIPMGTFLFSWDHAGYEPRPEFDRSIKILSIIKAWRKIALIQISRSKLR